MMNYILTRNIEEKQASIFDINPSLGLILTPKNADSSLLSVSKLYLLDDGFIRNAVLKRVDKKVNKLLLVYASYVESGDDDSGVMGIFLDELSKIRLELKIKYRIYLQEKDYELLCKKLDILENATKTRAVKDFSYEEKMGRAR